MRSGILQNGSDTTQPLGKYVFAKHLSVHVLTPKIKLRTQEDSGNPFEFDVDDKDEKFATFALYGAILASVLCAAAAVYYAILSPGAIPKHQRESLKAFIIKKESQALTIAENESANETFQMLEDGAVDCLHGLFQLYNKILAFEPLLESMRTNASHDIDVLSKAAWRNALQHQKIDGVVLEAEEVEIAQILFDAADLDDEHRMPFTEFATLAVLMSATDEKDADAQVGLLSPGARVCLSRDCAD